VDGEIARNAVKISGAGGEAPIKFGLWGRKTSARAALAPGHLAELAGKGLQSSSAEFFPPDDARM
jgi:hypothetical protein